MRKLINEIEELRGSVVQVFGQPHEIELICEDELIIDTVELLESLEEYEVDFIEIEEPCEYCQGDGTVVEECECSHCDGTGYEEETCDECDGFGCECCEDGQIEITCSWCFGNGLEEYEECCDECDGNGTQEVEEDALRAIEILEDDYEIEEVGYDNSYNWNAPLSNHIDYRIYRDVNGIYNDYIVLKVHKYGDVRGNYTDEVVLEMSHQQFVEKLAECSKEVEFEIDGIQYKAVIDAVSDTIIVTDEDYTLDKEFYGYDIEDLKQTVKEWVK